MKTDSESDEIKPHGDWVIFDGDPTRIVYSELPVCVLF